VIKTLASAIDEPFDVAFCHGNASVRSSSMPIVFAVFANPSNA
jgi:hypothetical protein